jgi:AcrR family transcriptional regulator
MANGRARGREARREEVLDLVADHLLREGLAGASLRPLAAAAGTSDRMLLYYFADKDELLAGALGRVAERLARLLDADLAAGRGAPVLAYPDLLAQVWTAVRGESLRPYMRLWLDLAARAARGDEPYLGIAGRITDGFLAWAEARLSVERQEERAPLAALLLATVDGAMLLDAAGRAPLAAAAVARATAPPP